MMTTQYDLISANPLLFPTPVDGNWAVSQTELACVSASLVWVIMGTGQRGVYIPSACWAWPQSAGEVHGFPV